MILSFSIGKIHFESFLLGLYVFFWALPLKAEAPHSLLSFLNKVKIESEDWRSAESAKQSLYAEIDARDLVLSASVDVQAYKFWDDRPSFSSNYEQQGNSLGLTLQKPFSSGTKLNLLSELNAQQYRTTPPGEQNDVSWQVGVFQSLWQDSFGRQTTFRRLRDARELDSRWLELMDEQQQLLIEFEQLYWDIAFARKELDIREKNLDLSRKILAWVTDRMNRSASEKVDIYQAEALSSMRQLQVQVAAENLRSLQSRLKERIKLDFDLSPDPAELMVDRHLESLITAVALAPKEPTLLSSLIIKLDAERLSAEEKLEKDALKPQLELGFIYGQKGLNSSKSSAFDGAWSSNNEYREVGFSLSTPLNFPLISQARRAAELRTESERIKALRADRQSVVQWQDLQKTISELQIRIKTATGLALIQKNKSEEERKRVRLGRATLFEAITFEQDAAESELLVLQLQRLLRRTEAQARAFVSSSGQYP